MLKVAISSIAAQTYRPIDVVLVNDGGCDLDIGELESTLGNVSLNYIRLEKNTGRAHAGNVGIENAQGEYIGFLDDDDELYPEHVETLASILDLNEYRVVYSDVEVMLKKLSLDHGEIVDIKQKTFSYDFNYPALTVSNYIPFNSILLDKKIVDAVGHLDETFDLYEDWEFLIRIGEKFPFYHVKKITALYNQWSKDEQINQKDVEHMRAMHLRVLKKHREKISTEYIFTMWKDSQHKDYALVSKDNELIRLKKELKNTISEKDGQIIQLHRTIHSMKESLGWRLLDRFRKIRERYFPVGAGRRKIYDLAINAIKTAYRGEMKSYMQEMSEQYKPLSDRAKYELWIAKNEPDSTAIEDQRNRSREFPVRPLISIITPVFNPDKKVFIEMIESVVSQTYDNWELCLADASTESHVRRIIEEYMRNNGNRIKVKYLHGNKGITGNSNEALSLATGDFIALLDHDDTLAPFALFEVVKAINENRDIEFIYSDRDIISYDNQRLYPFFKPDWSPDYLLAQNYLCHLNVFRKKMIDEIGGFREGYDGSQDYDLLLRVTEFTNKITHIPKILYHWRIVHGSASVNPDAKVYAYNAAVRALQDAIYRRGWKGTVTHGSTRGFYNIKLDINGNPGVSIVIPSKNGNEMLKRSVNSLQKTTYNNCEIVIVSNNNIEEWISRELSHISNIKLLKYDKPFHFFGMSNYAVPYLNTEYVLFLDQHTEIISTDLIELLLGFAQRKGTGAVGAKLIYTNGTIHSAGLIIDNRANVRKSHHGHPRDNSGYNGSVQNVHNVSAVSGICMMVRKEVFHSVGGFDTTFDEYGDIDFCLKLQEGKYIIVYQPLAELFYHKTPSTTDKHAQGMREQHMKEKELFLLKWDHILQKGDPYYNPNLTAEGEDFSLNVKY